MRFMSYSFYVICGDVYDRLDYETHATDKTTCVLNKHGAITYKNTMIEVICI